jgi:hypothetical protein
LEAGTHSSLRADWRRRWPGAIELGFQHVRFHALLSDDMGTLICEEEQLLYSFFNADQIVDFLLSIGMRRSSNSPSCLKRWRQDRTTVFRCQASTSPRHDYEQWATHSQARCTLGETLPELPRCASGFEVWNEPNLRRSAASQEDYFTLYRTTVGHQGVDRALRSAVLPPPTIIPILDYRRVCSASISSARTTIHRCVRPPADTITQLNMRREAA